MVICMLFQGGQRKSLWMLSSQVQYLYTYVCARVCALTMLCSYNYSVSSPKCLRDMILLDMVDFDVILGM